PGDVSAVVDDDVAVAREQPTVGGGGGAQPDRARLAGRARDELLDALELDLDRAAGAAGQERGDDVDRAEVEAPAKIAADGRLQHPHPLAADAERSGEVALVEERHLRGRP